MVTRYRSEEMSDTGEAVPDFPPLQGTHMSVCRIGGLMNTSFHSYSEWELFLLNNCAGRMNVPGHIPFKP